MGLDRFEKLEHNFLKLPQHSSTESFRVLSPAGSAA